MTEQAGGAVYVRCIGCGTEVPEEDGPVHAYMTSAPACWRMFVEAGARGMEWDLRPGTVQLRTDAYAAQHATNPDPRNRQSVALHLMSLCATLEKGLPAGATTRLMGRWTHRPGGYPDFTSPPPHGDVTVVDLHRAWVRDEYEAVVDAWARSVWESYSAVHDAVGVLLAEHGSGASDPGPGRPRRSPRT